jgi:hypothetical protein
MIKLLIVEDDKSQIEAFKDSIELFNKQQVIYDIPSYLPDLESSINDLENKPAYDAAIIDLKLKSGGGADEFEGKELINRIYNKIRIPIVVYSGNVSQVEQEETAMFLKRPRDQYAISQILYEITKIYDTGITQILSSEGIFEANLSEIFWSHLAPNLNYWIDKPDKKSLTRFIVNYIYEKLGITESGDFEYYNSAEVYITPPIKTSLHTGDIFDNQGEDKYIVITPTCDIETKYDKEGKPFQKASNVTVWKLNEFDVGRFCQDKTGKINKDLVTSFVKNNNNRYQYLPPFLNKNGYVIDFEEVSYVKMEFCTKFKRIASVSQVFLKDIISRFSQYYARQGQPVLGKTEELIDRFTKS